jgi:hypothetical protein
MAAPQLARDVRPDRLKQLTYSSVGMCDFSSCHFEAFLYPPGFLKNRIVTTSFLIMPLGRLGFPRNREDRDASSLIFVTFSHRIGVRLS